MAAGMLAVFAVAIFLFASEFIVLLGEPESSKIRNWVSRAGLDQAKIDWPNTSLFWGGFSGRLSLFLTVVATVLRDVWPLLICSGLLALIGMWAIIRNTTRTRGRRTLGMVLASIVIAGFLLYIYERVGPTIDCSLALIPTIYKMKDPRGGYMKGGQNDLVGVLRIRQKNGLAVRHVNSLRVVGDVLADFNTYVGAFSKRDGSEAMEDFENQYATSKPFFHLSWIVHPDSREKLDATDEEFIRFTISRSMGAISFPLQRSVTGISKDAFGFISTGQQPKYPMTTPVWSQLIKFSAINPVDSTGIYPKLRSEITQGSVKIQVDIDGEIINIPAANISFPWAVALVNGAQSRMLPEDLFYGIDNGGGLNSAASKENPLVEKEKF